VQTDLHFHLLPGIDDGPDSPEQALALARAAVADGTGTVVVTPHLRRDHVRDPRVIVRAAIEFRRLLRSNRIDLEIVCAAEVCADVAATLPPRALGAVAFGPLAAPCLLVECPFEGVSPAFVRACDDLVRRGFRLVLAHPELCELDGAGERRLRELLRRGALLQINALSIAGRHGPVAERRALDLVARGMGHLVASDAHGPTRPPTLSAASAALLAHGFSSRHVRRLVHETPWRLVQAGEPNARPCPSGFPSPPGRTGDDFAQAAADATGPRPVARLAAQAA